VSFSFASSFHKIATDTCLPSHIYLSWRCTQVDAASYSTAALVTTIIDTTSLLPDGQQVRTFVSTELRQQSQERPVCIASSAALAPNSSRSKFEQRLLRWSVLACEELRRAQRSVLAQAQDSDEEAESHFQIPSGEVLLLLHDYIESLDIDSNFDIVSLNPEEYHASKLNHAESSPNPSLTKEEIYRLVRINVTLLHKLWTLYRRQVALVSAPQVDAPVMEYTESNDDQKEIARRLQQLEDQSRRTDISLAKVLSQKYHVAPPSIANVRSAWFWNFPYVGLIDARPFLIFIVGVLLGSALKSNNNPYIEGHGRMSHAV
jgi:hypothetical protein